MAESPFDLKTPIQKIETDFILEHEIQVSMKRDDLIHPFVSGNKWRKLKYNVEHARDKNQKHLITAGGAYSNHLLATATAGAILKLETTGIVRGQELNKNSNHILKLCDQMGMSLHFVERNEYKEAENLAHQIDENALFIPQGGANLNGAKGCMEILDESCEGFNKIFVCSGTGTTALGIGASLIENQELHVIDCVGFDSEVEKKLRGALSGKQWKFHQAYTFGGFGRFTDDLINFSGTFTSQTGILLDPIYTAKMMYAIYDLARNGALNRKDNILCIHTGGMTGILSNRWLETG